MSRTSDRKHSPAGGGDAMSESAAWPTPCDPCGKLHVPITEDWLRRHGFRIEDGRNDRRMPVRRLAVLWDGVDGRQMFSSPDDLCIDVAPVIGSQDAVTKNWREWYVWIMQVEPYRHIHVRHMKYTWELALLYQGLTGRVWPGVLGE